MKLLNLHELAPDQVRDYGPAAELSAEEKAEVARLFMAQVSEAELQSCESWDDATSFEEFLNELKEEQKHWDEQHR